MALILSGVLGHVSDRDEVRAIIRRFMSELPSGSYLSHNDGIDENPDTNAAQDDYNDSGAVPYNLRSPEEIRTFYEGLELVPPGVVRINQWRPDIDADESPDAAAYGGVARKP